MANPVILVVDDDTPVLRAVERDLRRQYGRSYRIVAADSGVAALEAVRGLILRGDPIALFLVDQRMPGMTGVEFLSQAIDLAPDAKRVLLTAYADTEVAIRAINEIRLDQYLMKPWDPPEEKLYPVIDDLLDDWIAAFRPAFEGVRLVGHRLSPRAHEIKDYLARNLVPYRWLDIETDEEARRLAASAAVDASKLPVLVFPDGTVLVDPTNIQTAEKLGRQTHAGLPFYDLVIVGGGPAGLAAAVYGASEGLKTLLVEREAPGGQAGTTSRIENYLGFPVGLSGADLTRRAVAQASRLGAEILSAQEATAIRVTDTYRIVTLGDGTELSCQALLIATGVSYRRLELPGIEPLTGSGVFYGAAITEAASYRGEEVAVTGGGNSAGQAAVYLARFARSVTLIIRGADIGAGMSQYLVDQISATSNIAVRLQGSVVGVSGGAGLQAIEVGAPDGSSSTLPVSALFIFIGQQPRTDWCAEVVERDPGGFILSGAALTNDGRRPKGWTPEREPYLLEASVPGVFVAGDVRSRSVKRIASAVGEGSMAVQFVHQYLAGV